MEDLPSESVVVCYSYAQKDLKFRERLDQHMSTLRRRGLITTLHSGHISAGTPEKLTAARHLEKAHIILLLISPDYMATDKCYEQMELALQRQHTGKAHVIPILLYPTPGWDAMPAAELASLPIGGRAITLWRNQNEAFASVADGICRIVEQIIEQQKQVATISTLVRDIPPPHRHATILQRETQVKEIYAQLMLPEMSAIVLTGLGGVGKSTLAAQVYHYAEELRQAGLSTFTHEALWLCIRPNMTIADLITKISVARGLHIPIVTHLNPQELSVELFRLVNATDIHQLIVLDQFDEWLDMQASPPVARDRVLREWLDTLNGHACSCRLLITSRLYPQSTHAYRQMYMQERNLQGLTREDGIALLRLWHIHDHDNDLARAVEVCSGHPLALVLLDTLLHTHHVKLTTVLDDPVYRRLFVENAGHNLFNAIYDSLNEIQRHLLLAFSIYREPVHWQAVDTILCAFSQISEDQVVQAVGTLLSYNLLQQQGTGERYALHSLVTEFAHELLAKGQTGAIDRYKAHTEAALYYQQQFLPRPIARRRRRCLADVHALVETVWHYCQAQQWHEGYALIQQESLFTDLLRWGEYTVLLELYLPLSSSFQFWQPEPALAACICNEMGEIYHGIGHTQEALDNFTHSLALYRSIEATGGVVKALNNLGKFHRSIGEIKLALSYYEQALNLSDNVQAPVEKGITFNNLGRAFASLAETEKNRKGRDHHYQQAIAYYQQALAIYEATHEHSEIARTLNNLGEVYDKLTQRKQALDYYRRALEQFREIQEYRGEGTVLNNLGVLHRKLGKLPEAFEYYIQSFTISHEIHDYLGEAAVLRNLGRLFILTAHNDVALACFLLAQSIYAELDQPERGIIPKGVEALFSREHTFLQIITEIQPRASQLLEERIKHGI